MNYYHTLGVSEDASHEEIKAAYRALASKWHPDKHNCSLESTTMMQKINQAFATLGNPEKRSRYDYDHFLGSFKKTAKQAKKSHFKAKNAENPSKTPPNGPKKTQQDKYKQPPHWNFDPDRPCSTCHGMGSIRVASFLKAERLKCPTCHGFGS